jgi:hypothetical protein
MKAKTALLFAAVCSCATAQYKVIFLPTPNDFGEAYAAGGGQIVGTAFGSGGGPFLWEGPPYDKYVRLMPAGFDGAIVRGVGERFQVGEGRKDGRQHALVWNGTAKSFIDLDSADYAGTAAYATDGKSQVGAAGTDPNGSVGHAILWHGSANSLVDLNPSGYESSHAYGVWGNVQVGQLEGYYACLWRGTPESMRRLPSIEPQFGSAAFGIRGDQIVGESSNVAMIWSATTLKRTSLGSPGAAYATNGLYQVGVTAYGFGAGGPFTDLRAVRWSGRAGTALDLHHFLPPGFRQSRALGIDENGVIVGWAYGDFISQKAVAWVPTSSRK